ncbi:ORF6N domain-containing protein [Lysinibacillus agricola]|uniref:ORF6N domain-containing protein n=1 Tax=Lysinibacillus agricola TaxID=2590012 RepID=A0ABX7AN16_9BACI|nr:MULTISPECIES: ORF6N domain-containing protein [Lysinibacillus]QQP10897.1 ORF6N domain-containing protein [Lysinibacillus agricola]
MSNLAIKETVKVMRIEIPNIHGGFGVDKKSILAKHIAEIHSKRLAKVNEAINNNRKRFKDNIDIIDAKNSVLFMDSLIEHNIFTKQSISNSTNIYLLSERGYAKLVKIFDDDKSWDLYDELLNEYFELRDGNIIPINNQPSTELQVLQGIVNNMVEQEKKMLEVNDKVLTLETEFNKETVSEGYKTNDNIARHFGLYSLKSKPHFNFIDAIAKHLRIYNTIIGYKDEYVNVIRTTVHGGNVGTAVYYSDKALEMMNDFLENELYLDVDYYKRGTRNGKFKEAYFELSGKTYKFNENTYKKYLS